MVGIKSLVYGTMEKKSALSNEELKRYVLIQTIAMAACISHALFSVFYMLLNCPVLVVYNLMGMAIIIACHPLIESGNFNMAGMIITLSMMLVIIADDYYIGNRNLSILYSFSVLVITMLIPYRRKAIQVVLGMLLTAMMVSLYLYGLGHEPVYQIDKWVEEIAVVNIFLNSFGVVLLVTLSRVTQNYAEQFHEEKMEELRTQAHRDALTKMYNRHYANMYLSELKECDPNRVIYMAVVDIDDFKRVNDTYGHDAGDAALRDVSRIMKTNLRKSDLVIRWGGEEFVLLLHDVPNEEAAWAAFEKIRKVVEAHIVTHCEMSFKITVTMGVCKMNMCAVDKCVDVCDKKLYEGKRSGKNKVVL